MVARCTWSSVASNEKGTIVTLMGRVVEAAAITRAERQEMFALMGAYYEGVTECEFAKDLAEKQWVIQVIDECSGAVRGFSTQMLLDWTVEGRAGRALFSGDTIVDRELWGRNPLVQLWGRLALSLMDEASATASLYWFLISKGFRTYRFLPVFFHEFYPRFDEKTPAEVRQIVDVLAAGKFATAYDPSAGVIRSNGGSCRLRPRMAEVTPARLCDPHVRHFIKLNPGHAAGDELCCLAPLTRENFTPAACRVIGSGLLAGAESP